MLLHIPQHTLNRTVSPTAKDDLGHNVSGAEGEKL